MATSVAGFSNVSQVERQKSPCLAAIMTSILAFSPLHAWLNYHQLASSGPQYSYDRCREAVIHHISTQLKSLFEVQSAKSKEMDDASRGYGLLLHAFGLRTEEMRAQYCAHIKEMVISLKWSQSTWIWSCSLHIETKIMLVANVCNVYVASWEQRKRELNIVPTSRKT